MIGVLELFHHEPKKKILFLIIHFRPHTYTTWGGIPAKGLAGAVWRNLMGLCRFSCSFFFSFHVLPFIAWYLHTRGENGVWEIILFYGLRKRRKVVPLRIPMRRGQMKFDGNPVRYPEALSSTFGALNLSEYLSLFMLKCSRSSMVSTLAICYPLRKQCVTL